jgi:hypothetical protein
MVNGALGWITITIGLIWGASMGSGFKDEQWLGGYASRERRLLRLGHISLVMLGVLNILFALCVAELALATGLVAVASWALVVGAVTMPICCALAAWRRVFQPLFVIPVLSLISGGLLTAAGMVLS